MEKPTVKNDSLRKEKSPLVEVLSVLAVLIAVPAVIACVWLLALQFWIYPSI